MSSPIQSVAAPDWPPARLAEAGHVRLLAQQIEARDWAPVRPTGADA